MKSAVTDSVIHYSGVFKGAHYLPGIRQQTDKVIDYSLTSKTSIFPQEFKRRQYVQQVTTDR